MLVKGISTIAIILENICLTRQEHDQRSFQDFVLRRIAELSDSREEIQKKGEKILQTPYNKVL